MARLHDGQLWEGAFSDEKFDVFRVPNNNVMILIPTVNEDSVLYSVSTKKWSPKYNGVVFEILGKHHWNFYNRIWHIFVHCAQKFVEI